MKKQKKKPTTKRVHPWAHPAHPLSSLPAAIMGLIVGLSAADQEVLNYLLSSTGPTGAHHGGTATTCGCFSCYKSFWARWDSSPDRHVIHLVIDAVEEQEEFRNRRSNRRRRDRRKLIVSEEDRKEILQQEEEHVEVDDCKGGSSVRRLVGLVCPWGFWN